MKHSIYSKKTLTLLTIGTVLCALTAVVCIRSMIILARFQTPLTQLLFHLAVASLAIMAGVKFVAMQTEYILFTDEELICYYWFRRDRSIRWDEIEEVGVGQVYNPSGISRCVFFAKSRLTAEEIDNLDLARHKCIYLRRLTRENYEMICKYRSGIEVKVLERWVK